MKGEKVRTANFLERVADVLEVDSIGVDDEFRQVPEWCSLKAFGLMVTLENDYGAKVGVDEFLKLRTVKDLYRVAFAAFAAELLGVPSETIDGESAMGTVPAWDSVMHLRMVMEGEKKFGCAYPLEIIPSIRKINDFAEKAVW